MSYYVTAPHQRLNAFPWYLLEKLSFDGIENPAVCPSLELTPVNLCPFHTIHTFHFGPFSGNSISVFLECSFVLCGLAPHRLSDFNLQFPTNMTSDHSTERRHPGTFLSHCSGPFVQTPAYCVYHLLFPNNTCTQKWEPREVRRGFRRSNVCQAENRGRNGVVWIGFSKYKGLAGPKHKQKFLGG